MKMSSANTPISRRRFLATASATVAVPTFIPLSALKGAESSPPSEQITIGIIGCGGMGNGNTDSFLRQASCRVMAACDVDKTHLDGTVKKINAHYNNENCNGYADCRDLVARTDIDAVMLALPDHWHSIIAAEAARHKKDIYGEKPLARTIAEQQAIVKAVQANKRIWQTGSWQRSRANFHKAAEIVGNGLIGTFTDVAVGQHTGHVAFKKSVDETLDSQ